MPVEHTCYKLLTYTYVSRSIFFFPFPQFSLGDMALTQGSNTIYSMRLSQEAAEAKDVQSFGRGVDFQVAKNNANPTN